MCYLVRRYLESIDVALAPEPLALRWHQGKSQSRRRNPGYGSYRFARLCSAKPWAQCISGASWIFKQARDASQAEWCSSAKGLRRLGATIFLCDCCRGGGVKGSTAARESMAALQRDGVRMATAVALGTPRRLSCSGTSERVFQYALQTTALRLERTSDRLILEVILAVALVRAGEVGPSRVKTQNH